MEVWDTRERPSTTYTPTTLSPTNGRKRISRETVLRREETTQPVYSQTPRRFSSTEDGTAVHSSRTSTSTTARRRSGSIWTHQQVSHADGHIAPLLSQLFHRVSFSSSEEAVKASRRVISEDLPSFPTKWLSSTLMRPPSSNRGNGTSSSQRTQLRTHSQERTPPWSTTRTQTD